jgi:hypothetical protein
MSITYLPAPAGTTTPCGEPIVFMSIGKHAHDIQYHMPSGAPIHHVIIGGMHYFNVKQHESVLDFMWVNAKTAAKWGDAEAIRFLGEDVDKNGGRNGTNN